MLFVLFAEAFAPNMERLKLEHKDGIVINVLLGSGDFNHSESGENRQ